MTTPQGPEADPNRALLAELLGRRAARPKAFPLSFSQQRLWFLNRLEPGNPAYNLGVALRLQGELREPVFEACLREIARRHKVLQTTFGTDEVGEAGEPVQIVSPGLAPALHRVDLDGLPAEVRQGEALRLAPFALGAPFDLGRGPLLRVALLRLGTGEWAALVALHHIVADGWSLGVLIRELGALYAAFSAGRPSPLPKLPVQYGDFAQWQRQWLRGEVLETQLGFWRERLQGAAVLELPADRPRPAVKSSRGASLKVHMPPTLREALNALAQREGATLFMVLLAGFQALLHRWSGQEGFCVGIPVAYRNRQELEGLIGFFANTLVLRADLAGEPGFRVLLARVRESALDAYAHQDVPFEKLVEALHPERDLSRTPLFQAAFALQNNPPASLEFPGLTLSPLPVGHATAKFDLSLELSETAGGLEGSLEYSRDLFDRPTMVRLLDHFERLLAGIAAAPDTRIAGLPLLSEAERAQVVREWSDTVKDCPQRPMVHELFALHARQRPEATAIADAEGRRLTYGELEARSNRLAWYLRSLGVGPDVLVAVCTERTLLRPVGILGIVKAGGAYVTLDPAYPPERLAFLLEDSRAPVLLTEERFAGSLSEIGGTAARVILLDGDWEGDESVAPESGVSPDNLAYVVYTSGSTGKPKGVEIPHAGLMNLVRWHQDLYGVKPGDRGTQIASPAFDASIWELWPYLSGGASLHIPDAETRLSSSGMIRWWAEQGITLAYLMTPLAEGVLEEKVPPGLDLRVRALIIGGDRLHRGPDLEVGFRLMNHYGPAEYAVTCTVVQVPPRGQETGVPTIGRAIDNTRIYLLDRHGEPVPVGVPGELYVAGVGLARGYHNRPDLTAEKLVPDPFAEEPGSRMYRTADLVRWLPDGDMDFLGRLDHQVKIRGLRIELGEIETVLEQHPNVREAVVLVREDRLRDKRLTAYVVARQGELPADGLRDFLRQRLPDYMVPRSFVRLDSLPLTANGKVDRKALPAPERPPEVQTVPGTPLEGRIAAVWAELLQTATVGVEDNFFDLGGHSLLMVRMQHRLREELSCEISLLELFQYPTVRLLAERIGGPPAAGEAVAVATRSEQRRKTFDARRPTGIAVIGMAGRFPGARDLDEFWRNLCGGVESLSRFTEEELIAAGLQPEVVRHPRFVPVRGVIDEADGFDAGFFGFNPREAQIMDPQHRVFLECCWQALEDAGYGTGEGRGSVGVFAGANISFYLANLWSAQGAGFGRQAILGNGKDHLPTFVSYKLNLKGPSVNVQTACSTSLVAVHMACQSLALGECDMALAGGASLYAPLIGGYLYEEGGILSQDGHCRAFDADAGGTVGGCGVGVVALKPLAAALADGDSIYAVIQGTAINNDGSDKIGYTAPSVPGQAAAIAEAQEMAGFHPETIGYVEAHGTGTRLGDPIEVTALTRAFRRQTDRRGFCALGSVKTNIGHLDSAAGVTGLIKAVLAVRHGQVPPSLHFERPNPEIDFESSPFFVNAELRPWPLDGPRRAGVSSFGLGGTNSHVVLEEAPASVPSGPGRPWKLLLLSARGDASLERRSGDLADYLEAHPEADLDDVAYTLQAGRTRFDHRRALVCRDTADAVASLRGGRSAGRVEEEVRRPVAFLFPGLGPQYVGMGRELYRDEEVFRREVDRCCELLRPHVGMDLRSVFHAPEEGRNQAAELLNRISIALPSLFTMEYSLARLWMSWGIEPQAMLGHSNGEYVAACLAGVFSLEDALMLVSARARLMQGLPEGGMLAVSQPRDRVEGLLGEGLDLALINAADLCVASGPCGAVDRLAERLAGLGIESRRLRADRAYHSAMMEPMMAELARLVGSVERRPPRIPYGSNVTGTWIQPEQATDPRYWARHVRDTVRFADGVDLLLQDDGRLLLEVGPGATLGSLVRRQGQHGKARAVLSSLPGRDEERPDLEHVLWTLGRFWLSGVPVDWQGFHAGARRRRLHLPTYPFERRRYWIDASPAIREVHDPAARRPMKDWTYAPSWKRGRALPLLPALDGTGPWLLFLDSRGLGEGLAGRLRQEGRTVLTVEPGDRFDAAPGRYRVRPGASEDYRLMVDDLAAKGLLPARIVHLWTVTGMAPSFEEAQELGFHSLLALSQALSHRGDLPGIDLAVVSSGLHEVVPGDGVEPEKATVLGPVRVIPQELPGLRCRSIDVGAVPAEALLAELGRRPEEVVVALRGAHRWVQHFEAVPLEAPGRPVYREGGVYLITGGLGKLGLELAAHLVNEARARLVLVGRSGVPPGREWAAWLETHGADVTVAQADVADRSQMAAVVAAAEARYGRIDGVIHLAAVTDLELIRDKSPERADRVLRSKALGALVLADLFRDRPLDFLLLFSSIASVSGGFGTVDYTAANAVLDALAHREATVRGPRTLAVNWTHWHTGREEDGERSDRMGRRAREQSAAAIWPYEGMEVLDRVLASPLPQVLVVPRDLAAELSAIDELLQEREERQARRVSSHDPRPPLSTPYVPPRDELEEALAAVWRELLGIEEIGIDDNFYQLGGHSLLATQVASRIRETLQVEVPLGAMLAHPTVAGLAVLIAERQAAQLGDTHLSQMIEEIQGLSEEDLRALLAEEAAEGLIADPGAHP